MSSPARQTSGPWLGLWALAVGAAAGLRPISGLDIWWHLRTGERLWHEPGWLAVDTLSDGAAGQPWPYKDVLSDVLLYLAHAGLGDAALSVLPALAAAAVGVLTVRPAGRRRAPTALAALVMVAALAATLHRLHARPMLMSLVSFAALLPWLERSRDEAGLRGFARASAPVLALLVLWGWLHRGVLLGVLTAAASAWFGSARAPATRAARAGAVLAIGALAACLNPNGLATFGTAAALVSGAQYQQHVSEWQAMGAGAWLRHHGTILVPLGLLVVALARQRGAADEGPLNRFAVVLAVGLTVASALSARYLPYAAIAAGRACLFAVPRAAPSRRSSRLAWVAAVALLAFVLWERPASPLRTGSGWLGRQPGRYPSAALAWARDHNLPARVENAYDFGGYLLWHADGWLLPSVDGRADMVYPPDVFDRALRAERDPRAFAAQQAAADRTWVLARQDRTGRSHAFLGADPRWCLVFWSEPAVIFVRRDAHGPLCETDGLRHFRSPSLDADAFAAGSDPARRAAAAAELERLTAMAPQSTLVRIAEVVFAHASGDMARRGLLLERLVADHPRDPAVLALLRRLAGPAQPPR
jgi:hypothetical protein